VRTGADKGILEMETTDDIMVKRIIEESLTGAETGDVKVTIKGEPKGQPETTLKGLMGADAKKKVSVFAFNPVDFMTKKDSEQTNILLSLIPIEVTREQTREWFNDVPNVVFMQHGLNVLKDSEEWFYDMRREINVKKKTTESEILALEKSIPDNYKAEEWKDQNLAEVHRRIYDADEINRKIDSANEYINSGYSAEIKSTEDKFNLRIKAIDEEKTAKTQAIKDDVSAKKQALEKDAQDIRSKIAVLQKDLAVIENRIENLQSMSLDTEIQSILISCDDKIKQIKSQEQTEKDIAKARIDSATKYVAEHESVEVDKLKTEAEDLEKMKSYIPNAERLADKRKQLEEEKEKHEHYDSCVEIARAKPLELLKMVELPVPGLGLDENGMVTIDDLPLSNLSTSKGIRVALNIARAISKNNELKIICVDRLETLDTDLRAEFYKQIEADEEYQYFVTEVTSGPLKIESK